MVELLSPVGDFNCLKAAVQNGADSVYFGSDTFSARAFATNFSQDNLKKAIEYAKIRGVKTNLTLNTLIKDTEFNEAFNLAQKAYELGIDAIIVQDLGLAITLIKNFPDLPIHASTQMTVHNLNGALKLQELGFKRIVLARELSINDIDYICKNTKVEIETFIHGALCISYSGQCLFSSMLGGRSGNRGKCAGPCRLPFSLYEEEKLIDSGYLLNTRDLCGIDYIPQLIDSGVKCFKIEGRMKSPEYVATVTRIYRKYIDLALSKKEEYTINENDKKDLLQVFNRGMSSPGHLSKNGNHSLVFKEKPNNMGLFLGKIEKYLPKKGYITIKLNEKISIGDTISLENETTSYTISELMNTNFENITQTQIGQTVIIGRIKGHIKLGSKIYKMSSKELNETARESFSKEYKKIGFNCNINIKLNKPIEVTVTSASNLILYKNLKINYTSTFIPTVAINKPLDKETVINQFNKTNNYPFYFKNIKIDMDDNIFIPKISILNEIRRVILEEIEKYAEKEMKRTFTKKSIEKCFNTSNINNTSNTYHTTNSSNETPKISVLLNNLNLNFDYSNLRNFDNIYIPLKFFSNKKYENILKTLSNKFALYIYMPTIIQSNYKNIFLANSETAIQKFKIRGFIISNICNLKLLEEVMNKNPNIKIITNYTFNVFNTNTVNELKKMKVLRYTISPELDKHTIAKLCTSSNLEKELIAYGKIPLINMNYCLLGKTDKCYPTCTMKCQNGHTFKLKDRYNMDFTVVPDNIQTVTTIYNSKIISIPIKKFNIDVARIDILNEKIETINKIVQNVRNNKKFEGKNYTNGNLNREI